MPVTNYCRKCKADAPMGEVCPRCGGKLTKTGERLSIEIKRIPVTDWFSWNAMLRIVVPVVALVLFTTVLLEGLAEGAAGVQAVFVQGFFWTLMGAFGLLLLFTLCLLLLQGREVVRYTLDAKGAHAYTYVPEHRVLPLYARMATPQAVAALQADVPEANPPGMMYIKRADVLWADTKRARFWPETQTILLYRPSFWQVLCIRCDVADYEEAEAFVLKKLNRNKAALPKERRKPSKRR